MNKIFFIRHGESIANALGECAGQSDSPLSQRGIDQAIDAGQNLLDSELKIDIIMASTLARSLDTARLIADKIKYSRDEIIIDRNLIERYCGSYQGKKSPDWPNLTPRELEDNGVESERSMQARAQSLLKTLANYRDQTVLLVSHDQFGRTLIAAANKTPKDILKEIPNAETIPLYKD